MLMPVTVYLPNYYATDLGVGLGAIGFAFAMVRLFDLWLDPTLGFFIDKTNTRFGRFKPWLIAGLPLAVLSIWMLFMAAPGIDGAYILFWLMMGFIGQSMASMAHVTWAARISSDYHQRARVFGWWQGFTVLGMLVVLAAPPFTSIVLGLDHTAGVKAIGWFVLLSMPLAIVLAVLAVREPPSPRNIAPPNWRHLLSMARRPSVLRLLAVDILLTAGPAVAGTLFFFYFDAVRGLDRSTAGLLLLLYFCGALAGATIWGALGPKLSKHQTLAIASLAYAGTQVAVLVMPNGILWAALCMSLAGVPFSAGAILLRAMMADLADEERLTNGVDRSGLLFGLLSGAGKIGSALAVFFSVSALGWVGFDATAGERNPSHALAALSFTFALLPALLGTVSAMIIASYRVDRDAHDAIRHALETRDTRQEDLNTSP